MDAVPTPTAVQLGTLIRSVRKGQSLTQIDLSAVAGVSPLFLHNLEHGKATVRLDGVMRVLSALGLSLAVIDTPVHGA
jgi:y4mF family transcriptional regulator